MSRFIRSRNGRYRIVRAGRDGCADAALCGRCRSQSSTTRGPVYFDSPTSLSFGYCSRKLKELTYEGRFTPPSLKGSLTYPATIGGVEWGGGAVDPNKQIFVVNNSSAVQIYKLIPRKEYDAASRRADRKPPACSR